MSAGPAAVQNPPMASVNRAFSKQAAYYDAHDDANQVLRDMRSQTYAHLDVFLKANSRILELNAGTGIDAVRLVQAGHQVMATDWSDGMIEAIEAKIKKLATEALRCQKVSFTQLHQLGNQRYDHVFSNFGGLNCTPDLSPVAQQMARLLVPGGKLTWVIMPPVCPWEIMGLFFGHGRKSFRRLRRGGVMAHLENEYFPTHYHSLGDVRKALGPAFTLLKAEGLGAWSPPPHRADLPVRFPRLYRFLRAADRLVRHRFPFNRWADHIIVTFQYTPPS